MTRRLRTVIAHDAVVPPTSIERKIVRAVLGIPRPKIADTPVDAALAASVAGEYEVGDMRFGFDRVAFAYENGALEIALGGTGAPGVRLRFQGGKRFVSSKDDEEMVEFDTTATPARVTIGFYGATLVLHRIASGPP